MSIAKIQNAVLKIVQKYPIKRVVLFGSRASGQERADSDVDLIMEFSAPVGLLLLAQIKYDLEDELHVKVDVIHSPLRESDMIEPMKEVELYAA